MIRFAQANDTSAILAIAQAIGFDADEQQQLQTLVLETLSSEGNDGSDRNSRPFWLVDDDNGVLGVAYCECERMAQGTWNLLFIAVHPDRQGQGRGSALLRAVEQKAAEQEGRLLIVETSGTPEFEQARSFYQRRGYALEARVRDFYAAGDDKLIYRTVLADA